MSEDTDKMGAALAQLQAQISALAGGSPPAGGGFGPGGGGGFGAPPAGAPAAVAGVQVPIKITHQQFGELRIYLTLAPSALANPQALMAALQGADACAQQFSGGLAWYQRNNGGGFGGGRGGYGGGGNWNRGGGGGGWGGGNGGGRW